MHEIQWLVVMCRCPNDKFGGNGSVMSLHETESGLSRREENSTAHEERHMGARQGRKGVEWNGYVVRKGVGHEEGVELFKRFYVRENVKGKNKRRREECQE